MFLRSAYSFYLVTFTKVYSLDWKQLQALIVVHKNLHVYFFFIDITARIFNGYWIWHHKYFAIAITPCCNDTAHLWANLLTGVSSPSPLPINLPAYPHPQHTHTSPPVWCMPVKYQNVNRITDACQSNVYRLALPIRKE